MKRTVVILALVVAMCAPMAIRTQSAAAQATISSPGSLLCSTTPASVELPAVVDAPNFIAVETYDVVTTSPGVWGSWSLAGDDYAYQSSSQNSWYSYGSPNPVPLGTTQTQIPLSSAGSGQTVAAYVFIYEWTGTTWQLDAQNFVPVSGSQTNDVCTVSGATGGIQATLDANGLSSVADPYVSHAVSLLNSTQQEAVTSTVDAQSKNLAGLLNFLVALPQTTYSSSFITAEIDGLLGAATPQDITTLNNELSQVIVPDIGSDFWSWLMSAGQCSASSTTLGCPFSEPWMQVSDQSVQAWYNTNVQSYWTQYIENLFTGALSSSHMPPWMGDLEGILDQQAKGLIDQQMTGALTPPDYWWALLADQTSYNNVVAAENNTLGCGLLSACTVFDDTINNLYDDLATTVYPAPGPAITDCSFTTYCSAADQSAISNYAQSEAAQLGATTDALSTLAANEFQTSEYGLCTWAGALAPEGTSFSCSDVQQFG